MVFLAATSGTIDVHGMIKRKFASSWVSQVKAPATKVASILLKPRMMLDREKKGPNMVPDHGFRRSMLQDDLVFGQKFYIRSYEVGPDGRALVKTLMNHLQETTINHTKTMGFMSEGFGSIEMSKRDLTWVMVKMQMIVDRYPTWGDIVQIDTWKAAYGKNGVCDNWIFYHCKTGDMLGRASSCWVMMNKNTRKLSKFPIEVRAKIEQCFVDRPPIFEQNTRTWSKRDDIIEEDYICKGLKPRWSDLDINQHVNNVKYIEWILESVPKTLLENYEIKSMTLEYYRECTEDSVLQSYTSILANNNDEIDTYNSVDCQHLLQFEIGGGGGGDIMKARTRWQLKYRESQVSRAFG